MSALNAGYVFRETIAALEGAERRTLVAHLALTYPHSSEAEWRSRIALGEVEVDGVVADPEQVPVPGQVVTWRRAPWVEPEVPRDFAVVHEDEHVLVVDKPAGLPTLPGAGFLEGTLAHLVARRYPGARVAHRLGRFTSGLVLLGRTDEARSGLAAAFRDGRVFKQYRALASGRAASEAFEVRTPIGPVPHPPLGTVHAAHPQGRVAVSRVRVLEQREGHFLAEVVITTGRPHQIRIHLAAAGHPLVGDPLYAAGGLPIEGSRALPGDPGYTLRAVRIGLDHPVTGERLEVEAAESRGPSELAGRYDRR